MEVPYQPLKMLKDSLISLILICLLSPISSASALNGQVSTEDIRAQFKKASDLIESGMYRDAEALLLRLKEEDNWKGAAFMLLGRLYMEEGDYEMAVAHLQKAAEFYPLLKDYALRFLADIYISTGEFENALEIVRKIKEESLLQEVRYMEIMLLLALGRKDEAREALLRYVKSYPSDWESRLTLAILLKDSGEGDKAIPLFKEIYINAIPILSEDALRELKNLKADVFTDEERLERAYMLYEKGDFKGAMTEYEGLLKTAKGKTRERLRFAIGKCQYRLKQYAEAASTFREVKGPRALYWQAKALYNIDDRENFNRVIRIFEERYHASERLARLLLMSAEDYRRSGDLNKAEEIFKVVLQDFPKKTEDALWGLAWLYYSSGDHKRARQYFSRLLTYQNSRDYYKYLYWSARNLEKLSEECSEVSPESSGEKRCKDNPENPFSELLPDESYYGYLIRFRSGSGLMSEEIELEVPEGPEGIVYKKIDALALLGLREEAIKEISLALKRAGRREELLYLGYTAIDLGSYKAIIAIAENGSREFLPLSYPLGYYWSTIKTAAEANDLDAYLVTALIREESRFDPMAVSWAGAIGLMQLMPSTAYRLKDRVMVSLGDNLDLYDAEKNILLGTHYLAALIREFKDIPLALAAYNAGENALREWLFRLDGKDMDEFIEEIPYRETRDYVKRVLKSYWRYRSIYGTLSEGSIALKDISK